MAICLICRFYHYTLEQVKELTINEFKVLSDRMVDIIKLENPAPEDQKTKPLNSTSLAGFIKKKKPKG